MTRKVIWPFLLALFVVQPLCSQTIGQTLGLSYRDPCGDCCNRFYIDADYLYWKIQNTSEPVPLVVGQDVSHGPFTGTFLGDQKIDLGWHSGARFAIGYWFGTPACINAEVNYFFLGKKSKEYRVGTEDNLAPRLRIPYFDVNLGIEDSIALSTPGRFAGDAYLRLNNNMQGVEANVIANFASFFDCRMNFGLLAGFRTLYFNENLHFLVHTSLETIPSIFNTTDVFDVKNNFYGGQLGASFDFSYCSFFMNMKAKVALGAMCQKLIICGQFETDELSDSATGALVNYSGGIFALPSNIGIHNKTRFSVIPEVDLNFGYQITDFFQLRAGYTAFYISNVLWAGRQIDDSINTTQSIIFDFPSPKPPFSGPADPKALMRSNGLWVQGFNIGFEFQF